MPRRATRCMTGQRDFERCRGSVMWLCRLACSVAFLPTQCTQQHNCTNSTAVLSVVNPDLNLESRASSYHVPKGTSFYKKLTIACTQQIVFNCRLRAQQTTTIHADQASTYRVQPWPLHTVLPQQYARLGIVTCPTLTPGSLGPLSQSSVSAHSDRFIWHGTYEKGEIIASIRNAPNL